jgi:hypothetical protein
MTGEEAEEARRVAIKLLSPGLTLRSPETARDSERVMLALSAGAIILSPTEAWLTGEDTRQLLAMARAGRQAAHDALLDISRNLTSQRKPLPLPLQEYLANEAASFRRKKGAPALSDWERNLFIAGTVILLCERYGLKPTRNRETKTESACSIVASVLGRFRINKREAAVEKIWKKYAAAWELWRAASSDFERAKATPSDRNTPT